METLSETVLQAARNQRADHLRALLRGMPVRLRPPVLPRSILAAAIAAAILGGVALYARELAPFGVSRSAMFAVLAAAAISSVAGFAFSALCGAVLVHLVESPVAAVRILLVCSIGMQFMSLWAVRREIDWTRLPRLLLGGVIGLPAGLWLLLHLGHGEYTRVLGALLLLYAGWMLLRKTDLRKTDLRKTDLRLGRAGRLAIPVGLVGGITGGMAALPGPFVTIWCSLQGWSKARQRGVTQPFILIMQLVSVAALYAAGGGSVNRLAPDLATFAYVPAALLGTAVGLSVFRRLSDRQFASVVNALLVASGLGMLA